VIADRLAQSGHDVLLLRSRNSAPALCREETFLTFDELDRALSRILSTERFDAVIHAAAVGDFGIGEIVVDGSVRRPGEGKLDSDSAPVIRLSAHPKLVDSLKERSCNGGIRVVAFKLTRGEGPEGARRAVAELFRRSGADLVVHNDLAERAGADAFPSEIHFPDGRAPMRCATRPELAAALERLMAGMPSAAPAHA
jgi:phosphopantothenoylcysteine decarboxylase/phosphopantothenate--cysteine ligase